MRRVVLVALSLVAVPRGIADEAVYLYEDEALPYDASAESIIADACEDTSGPSLHNGHFVLERVRAGDMAGYDYTITDAPVG